MNSALDPGKETALSTPVDPMDKLYAIDPKVQARMDLLLESDDCKALVDRAQAAGSAIEVLDGIDIGGALPPIQKLLDAIKPFDDRREYRSKEDYLRYLKLVYGFLMTPMEEGPPRMMRLFYPSLASSWRPDNDASVELLRRFYVETQMVKDLPEETWAKVRKAVVPEAFLAKNMYGVDFESRFKLFLTGLSWYMAPDTYSGPQASIDPWQLPGREPSNKPIKARPSFLKQLVADSLKGKSFTLVRKPIDNFTPEGEVIQPQDNGTEEKAEDFALEFEGEKLSTIAQLRETLDSGKLVRLDTYIGLSKIEGDYVLCHSMSIWRNEKSKDRRYPYSYKIEEHAIPLELPFLGPALKRMKAKKTRA